MDKQLTTQENKRIDKLYNKLAPFIRTAYSNIARSINTEQVKAYWFIGKGIVEDEQKGVERAEHGKQILKRLSERFTEEFGKGFGVRTLADVRRFYLIYQKDIKEEKLHTLCAKTHIPNLYLLIYCKIYPVVIYLVLRLIEYAYI